MGTPSNAFRLVMLDNPDYEYIHVIEHRLARAKEEKRDRLVVYYSSLLNALQHPSYYHVAM